MSVPPGPLVFVHIAGAFLLGIVAPLPVAAPPLVRQVGFGLSAIGLLLGLIAVIEFQRTRMRARREGVKLRLVTTGIYRWTRNPVYLGFVVMLVGVTLFRGNFWGVALAPVLVLMMNWLVIGPEETELAERCKEEFVEYRARVRRWL